MTMIDIDQFLEDIWTPLKDNTTVDQIMLSNQMVPPEELKTPRLVYAVITFSDTQPRQSIISMTETVPSEDENFEHDIEYTHLSHPQATLSINGYGHGCGKHIQEAREWFFIPGLADVWLRDHECVIREVMEIQDRTTFLETDWEVRFGFDVRLEFADVVEVTVDTIESVQINEDSFEE